LNTDEWTILLGNNGWNHVIKILEGELEAMAAVPGFGQYQVSKAEANLEHLR